MWPWLLAAFVVLVACVVLYDLLQTKHAILRNFPIFGHFRYLLESIGPELRQYIVTNDTSERPFSRDQRRWVYSSAKKQNNLFGFGTSNDLETSEGHLILKHAAFPLQPPPQAEGEGIPPYPLPCAKVLGAARGRAKAFRPRSIINVSAMSFGSLSARATQAVNQGCALAGCLHDTGEGGISPHHEHGGELIYQIGTGYFGCRAEDGGFSMERFQETVARHDVRAIEIKLSQGAKPGKGGVLPAAKVTPEIAAIRGIPVGVSCLSPSAHSAFSSVDEMLDFVESLAAATGLPVGIKSAIGEGAFWQDLAQSMSKGDRGVDFITVDGGEGGTGAAPLVYSDHVALPFKVGMARIHHVFEEQGVAESIVFAGSGRLGFPEDALFAFALGCDLVHVAREAMMAIGCIQAQACHTGHCPTGVATQNAWLAHGLDPESKAVRLANYIATLRKEIAEVSRSCGREHPALLTGDDMELLDASHGSQTVRERFGLKVGSGRPSAADREAIIAIMAAGGIEDVGSTGR